MINAYGPTESTVVTTWSDPLTPGEAPLIGRPIWNTRIYVLDASLRPVPEGAPGDLYVTGAGLARGYLNRPGLTADRFLPDPFGAPGARMYRTGDVVRWAGTAGLEFLGRADDQIKIRGFRVEPGEIETALRRVADIGAAVVVARTDESGGKRLVAYLVAVPGHDLDLAEVRSAVSAVLPDYMVPSVFVPLECLPLTPNGKLDYGALPTPTVSEVLRSDHVPPVTETERVLTEIWCTVLDMQRIGTGDNFFELGGDSVRSLRVAAAATDAFGVDLTPRDVLVSQTVGTLAELIEERILQELERLAATGPDNAEWES
jgi:acyl carrier protein